MAKTITSTNSEYTLVIPGVFPVGQPLQGYAADDAFSNEAPDFAEIRMGVDGIMSAGYTPAPTKQTVTLQPDSPSIAVFDTWLGAIKAGREIVYANASIVLPGVQKSYTLTKGVLTTPKQMPDVKKVLEPQTYVITWESILPANFVV